MPGEGSIPSPPPTNPRPIRRVATRALGWQSAATVAGQATQVGITLTAAVVVSPSEFALWGIAMVIFNAQNLVGNFGLGAALLYRDTDDEFADAVNTSFLITTTFALMAGLVLFVCSGQIASFFENGFSHDDVRLVIQVMSVVFVASTVASVPQALLEKAFNFRRRAIIDSLGSFTYALAALTMLLAGAGIWSLIIAKAIQALLLLLLFLLACPIRLSFSRTSPRIVRSLLGYGKYFTGTAVLAFLVGNFDNIVIGRWAGAAALGAYALAFSVANLAPTFLAATLGKVFFPLYTSLRRDAARLHKAYQGSLHYVTVLMLPISVALATVVPPAFVSIFGNDWEGAAPLLRVLALYALARALGGAAVDFLAAVGRPRIMLWVQVLNFAITLLVLVPVRNGSATEIALAFTAGQVGAAICALIGSRSWLDTRFLAPLAAPAIATVVALGFSLLPFLLSSGSARGWLTMLLFAIVYCCALVALDTSMRATCRPLLNAPLLRQLSAK